MSNTPDSANAATAALPLAPWFGADSPDNLSAAWCELRKRTSGGEKLREIVRPDGTRGWLLYTIHHVEHAVVWEDQRHEIIYGDIAEFSPNTADEARR